MLIENTHLRKGWRVYLCGRPEESICRRAPLLRRYW